jgi:hypothetical protein
LTSDLEQFDETSRLNDSIASMRVACRKFFGKCQKMGVGVKFNFGDGIFHDGKLDYDVKGIERFFSALGELR